MGSSPILGTNILTRSECREVLISKLVGMTNIRKIRHEGGTELWEVANSL